MSKRKVSVEDKIYAVNLYLNGKESQHGIATMFDVCVASVQQLLSVVKKCRKNKYATICHTKKVLYSFIFTKEKRRFLWIQKNSEQNKK